MKKIGRYIIRGLLGRGGMSKVYLVSLPVIGGTAALKLLSPHSSLAAIMGIETIRDQFTREALTMANLRHPNIVAIRDFDEAAGKLFYVMEFFSNNIGDLIGETYRTEAPSRILSVDKAIHYTRQIIQGISRLHHDGIIHRDIKPFNLLITEQDQVKICDFGLSRLRGEQSKTPDSLKIGSPFYAAPEQENSPDTAGMEADIFSVGVVLYRMLTGKLPFIEPNAPLIPPSRINPDLDSLWDDFLSRSLATDPSKRIQNTKNMEGELETLAVSWADKKTRICRLADTAEPTTPSPPGLALDRKLTTPPRNRPLKIPCSQAETSFSINSLKQPLTYPEHLCESVSPQLICDSRTGLLWQFSGSAYPLSRPEAKAYVDDLNQRHFQGRCSWRLPTIPELLSIMVATPHETALCLSPVFDTRQKWLWSADKCTFTTAWYVNMEMGYVAKNDFSALYYVKAVSSPSSP